MKNTITISVLWSRWNGFGGPLGLLNQWISTWVCYLNFWILTVRFKRTLKHLSYVEGLCGYFFYQDTNTCVFSSPKIDVKVSSLLRGALRLLQPILGSKPYLPHTSKSINTWMYEKIKQQNVKLELKNELLEKETDKMVKYR